MAGAGTTLLRENQLNMNVLLNISGQPWFMPGVWPLGHIGATIIKDKAGFQIQFGLKIH